MVGREGVEPPKLSRVVYSHLSSPMPMPTQHSCRHADGEVEAIVPARVKRPTA
jgi:hypothetical protein